MEYNRKPKYAGIESLEEGEILSDDLEAISDDPIDDIDLTPSYRHGKSLKHSDHLTDLSLSNISEIEENVQLKECRRKRRKFRMSRKRVKHSKQINKICFNSDSSSDENIPSTLNVLSLKSKLKAAVKIEEAEVTSEIRKNTLRTRLQPLIDETIILNNNCVITKLENECVEGDEHDVSNISDAIEEHDTELIQLRIDALKTALQNKFVNGKSKKRCNKNITSYATTTNDDDKANTNNNCKNEKDITKPSTVVQQQSDDDEDSLRAQLLATMSSNQRSKTKTIESTADNKTSDDNLKTNIKKNLNTLEINSVNEKNQYQFNAIDPTLNTCCIKPLIISLNSSDSDSDLDVKEEIKSNTISDKTQNINCINNNNVIENYVEKFLRDQRAKVELEKQNSKINLIQFKSNPSILPKDKCQRRRLDESLLKLLPENKQREYHELLLKLKIAGQQKRAPGNTKKPLEIRNNSRPTKQCSSANNLLSENRSVVNGFNVLPLNNNVKHLNGSANIREVAGGNKGAATSTEQFPLHNSTSTSSYGTIFYRIMKQIHIKTNGRFQIQKKYEPLRQLAKKIKISIKEQQQYDQEEKNLMEKLEMVRKRRKMGRKNIANSIRNLTDRKDEIDKKNIDKEEQSSNSKCPETEEMDNQLDIHTTVQPLQRSTIDNVSNQSELTAEQTTNNKLISNNINSNNQNYNCIVKSASINNELSTVSCSASIKNIIMDKQPVINGHINNKVKYISLLDHTEQKHISDPLQIICPFAMQGSCKDSECTFNHFINNA